LRADDVTDDLKSTIDKFDEMNIDIGLRALLGLKGNSKPLGLNKTNYKKLRERFGKDEAKWSGKQITIRFVMANNPTTRHSRIPLAIAAAL